MKKNLTITFLLLSIMVHAQNVGIGTNSPTKKLSINGSLAVDQGNTNYGTLDSAALIFGSNNLVGINSNKVPGGVGQNGMDFWTSGAKRLSINHLGNVGINTIPDNLYRFTVDGASRFKSDAYFEYDAHIFRKLTAPYATFGGGEDTNYVLRVYGGKPSRLGGNTENHGNFTIGGSLDNNYRLRVIGGNSRFGGDAQVTGRTAIGGDVDDSYRLRVYDGNSRFGGNIEVTGQINAGSMDVDALAIGGKGSVKSDGLSPLRIGFASKYVDINIPAGATEEFTVNITDFAGDNDDIRVSVSQFAPAAGSGALAFERTIISVTSVNAANDTCVIKLHNTAGGSLYLKGTIYLMCVAKN